MIINGVELDDIDIYDFEVAEKYENAIEKLKTVEDDVVGKKNSEAIRIMCNKIFDVFNDLFGVGTDEKIFGEKVNLLICIRAIEELKEQVDAKGAEAEKLINKYSPNRTKKPANKKK